MSPHPHRLRHRVGEAIATHALWNPGDRVAVAVSAGRDSTALLDLLVATVDWHRATLSVVHVDHQTRPETADDARFVADLAAHHGLSFAGFVVDGGPGASEAALRDARYAAFDELDVERVALGHHRRDQAETVLLRLLQGAGNRGLGGMRPRRGRYVRPMLEVAVDDLARWVEHRGLRYRDDPSNRDPRFLRNRVRNELLPLVEDMRPGAVRVLARTAGLLADDEAWIEAQLDARGLSADGPWPVTLVQALPRPLLRRFCLRRHAVSAGQIDRLTQLVSRGYGASLVASGWTWEIADGWLSVRPPTNLGG